MRRTGRRAFFRVVILGVIPLLSNRAISQNTFPASGNVGIGTTSPTWGLTVASPTGSVGIQSNLPAGSYNPITQSGDDGMFFSPTGLVIAPWTVNPSGIRITSNIISMFDNVGIGVVNPQAALEVGGLGPGASESATPGLIQIQGNSDINSGANGLEFKAAISGSGYGWKISSPDRSNSNTPLTFAYRASSGTWAELVTMRTDNANVGIGTTNPQYKLSVNGTIQAKEVLVNTGWADYVFRPDYRVRSLAEVATFIKANRHLPDIPSEAEIKDKGVSLGDMQTKLLAKVEELTLQMIQLDEKNRKLDEKNRKLTKRVAQLEER